MPYSGTRGRVAVGCFLALSLFISAMASVPAGEEQPVVVDVSAEAEASGSRFLDLLAGVDSKIFRSRLLETVGEGNASSSLTNWYSGRIRHEGRWIDLTTAQDLASTSKPLQEYYEYRSKASDTLTDHRYLAKVCRDLELEDLEHMHNLHVLRFAPHDKRALKTLKMQWYRRTLVKTAEIERLEKLEAQLAREAKQWEQQIRTMRRDIELGGEQQQLAAEQKLNKIDDPKAVPVMIDVFAEPAKTLENTERLQNVLMQAIGDVASPEAVETLVKNAVHAETDSVRYTAIEQLRRKQFAEYVPLLMSELELPVQPSVTSQQIGNQIVNSYTYAKEDASGELREQEYRDYQLIRGSRYIAIPITRTSVTTKLVSPGHVIPARTIPGYQCGRSYIPARTIPARRVPPRYATTRHTRYLGTGYIENPEYLRSQAQATRRAKQSADSQLSHADRINQTINTNNKKVAGILRDLTKEEFDQSPRLWWKWWKAYLEGHPELAALRLGTDFNDKMVDHKPQGLPRGTWIWTRQGKRPVESILPGDYVLSQNPATGELDYKVVLAIQRMPKVEARKLELESGTLFSSAGQRVWVTGIGWRQTAQVDQGMRLHGVAAEPRLIEHQELYELDGHGLIVADFHTLFAGEAGVLLHDGSPPKKRLDALPGISTATVAEAAKLAVR